ncbi:hypothetical protein CDD82_195 [Ophiocordyceps australis]|uniref:Uncharacterized protein n=1 Tax=Ophiocordyceps australis TaxID=1399860 RepID=A0A2C5YMG5_9HYPO|nr:hypothetical protein CDD82_195 [Ophiocordyceps australis]
MRVARGASEAALDASACRRCSADPDSLLCLAALVPAACHAYAAVLDMIDADAAAARRQSRTLFLALKDIGGLCGLDDAALRSLDCRFLDPDTWRQTMRALLRLDLDGLPDDAPHAAGRPRGLRQVLARLDQAWRPPHDGLLPGATVPKHPPPQYLVYPVAQSPDHRNCAKAIHAARLALDKLVIP